MAEVWVVTGGIGSGKSTICGVLGELGAITIDADRVGHSVIEPDGSAYPAVAERWPDVGTGGRIDRQALAEVVFSDPDQLRRLEALTHPAIAAELEARISGVGNRVVVVEISVPKTLVDVGWDRTIVADLQVEERIRRLVDRGMPEAEVRRRMSSQPSRDGWRARGRWIISTAGSHEEVAERVRRLWHEVISPKP